MKHSHKGQGFRKVEGTWKTCKNQAYKKSLEIVETLNANA